METFTVTGSVFLEGGTGDCSGLFTARFSMEGVREDREGQEISGRVPRKIYDKGLTGFRVVACQFSYHEGPLVVVKLIAVPEITSRASGGSHPFQDGGMDDGHGGYGRQGIHCVLPQDGDSIDLWEDSDSGMQWQTTARQPEGYDRVPSLSVPGGDCRICGLTLDHWI